jgi:glutamate racemase
MQRLGFLDWGIGGVGIFRVLRRLRPDVPVLYWSDTGATPYGRVPAVDLAARITRVVQAMADQGATQVVVACNAASTILPRLDDSAVPLLGVIEPAIGLARKHGEGLLGVVGGARTIRSGLYRRALTTGRRRVVQRIAQPLSAHIEAGRTGTVAFARDLRRILAPLAHADAILLACTHYPSVGADFQALAPRAVLLDPAAAVAEAVLARWSLPRGRGDRFVTTSSATEMRRAARTAWGIELGPCEEVVLEAGGVSAKRAGRGK